MRNSLLQSVTRMQLPYPNNRLEMFKDVKQNSVQLRPMLYKFRTIFLKYNMVT